MILIYHNPDSMESIECLTILKKSKKKHRIIQHVKKPLSEKKLKKIVKLLSIKPFQLIRTEDAIWKDHYQKIVTNEDAFPDIEYIKMMTEFPSLIKTPIVIQGEKAVLCHPPEKIFNFLID